MLSTKDLVFKERPAKQFNENSSGGEHQLNSMIQETGWKTKGKRG